MSRDSYRTVMAIFRGASGTGKAFFVDLPRGGNNIAIPRSVIHGADDMKIDDLKRGQEFTFRLFEWKAEQLGLA